jgi:hypothetical protein
MPINMLNAKLKLRAMNLSMILPLDGLNLRACHTSIFVG